MSGSHTLRRAGVFLFPIFLASVIGLSVQAQPISIHPAAPTLQKVSPDNVPDEPRQQSGGSLHGTVTDSAGSVIANAHVILVSDISRQQLVLLTDGAGFFNFTGLDPGTFELTVTSEGFAPWVGQKIIWATGENHELPDIRLQISVANMSVNDPPPGPTLFCQRYWEHPITVALCHFHRCYL